MVNWPLLSIRGTLCCPPSWPRERSQFAKPPRSTRTTSGLHKVRSLADGVAQHVAPQSSAGRHYNSVRDARHDFGDRMPRRPIPAELLHGNEFEEHAVIGNQTQQPVAWVLGGDEAFRSGIGFQEMHTLSNQAAE